MAGFWLRGASGGATALAAAVWGYWLVQSLFFVAPGSSGRAFAGDGDGFERARRRLLELLEENA